MGDIVLVHGTTQTAEGFTGLVEAFAERGHRASAVDVPSGGASSAAGYAALVARQLPDDLRDPVVAAHSASGLLLPAIARRVGARHQVWLAATVADFHGQRSLLAELQQDPHDMFSPEWLGENPADDPVVAAYFLFHDADLATLRQALTTVALCDLSEIYAETPAEDPARLPSTYVLPTEDRALRPDWMTRAAHDRLGVEPVPVTGGHNFYTAAPDTTAAVINDLCF
ncbi:alpha/beta hydrolase [Spiractinospora alimapuensis]|uniref:alpha/beta fold hydrolase n=1 Tax=Spiractinospora alimapuensis TaxID=2820884 RepID=UPI001F30E811|nr:alpha/beta hydrolase [Spiractinospora alimapuensis]QVQ54312.1 alpha/beta hydrolase [Spiractinospora alimapuensis]